MNPPPIDDCDAERRGGHRICDGPSESCFSARRQQFMVDVQFRGYARHKISRRVRGLAPKSCSWPSAWFCSAIVSNPIVASPRVSRILKRCFQAKSRSELFRSPPLACYSDPAWTSQRSKWRFCSGCILLASRSWRFLCMRTTLVRGKGIARRCWLPRRLVEASAFLVRLLI